MVRAQTPVVVTPPAADPVTLAEVKVHLRVDHDDEDDLIRVYIKAAVARLDGWAGILGQALVTQVWRQAFDRFPPGGALRLPLRPAQSVDSIVHVGPAGAEQTLDASSYRLATDALGPFVSLDAAANWPSTADRPDAVRVTATYGFGDAGAVPSPLKTAILLMVGDLYAFRETAAVGVSATDIPMSTTVDALIAPYRLIGL